MALGNIFEQYGIKEVADVQFEDISTGQVVLYLDTLKVSTIETTAEQTEAKGGKGNPPLIIWDFGKEINVALQDALFTQASLALMNDATVQSSVAVDVRKVEELTAATTINLTKTPSSSVRYINLSKGNRGIINSTGSAIESSSSMMLALLRGTVILLLLTPTVSQEPIRLLETLLSVIETAMILDISL
jgi:hypothetical protein